MRCNGAVPRLTSAIRLTVTYRCRFASIGIALLAMIAVPIGYAQSAGIAPDSEVAAFIVEFSAEHKYDRRKLERWFSQARVQYGILKAMSNPSTAAPWHV